MSECHRVLISTRNDHKTEEVRKILGEQFLVSDLTSAPEVGEVEETGKTFEENATLKSVAASQVVEGWVIADDSGLEVDALDGAPGVYSARFAGASCTDADNNALLLKKLEGVRGKDRSARFRCVIVLSRAGRKLAAFEGSVEGFLANGAHGNAGFGYDPLFIPEGHCTTFANLPPDTKNQISHRAKALEKLKAWRGWF